MSNRDFVSVSFQCPQELWQAIQRKADSLKKDPITVTIDTLNQAFGLSLSEENKVTTEEISQLKKRLNTIEQVIKPFLIDPYLSQKLVELIRKNSNTLKTETQSDLTPLVSGIDIYSASVNDIDDDIEDEPDEILYDFLPGLP
jgi:hypothetical protein